MATRCCCPPDSSDGRWLSRSARPTLASALGCPGSAVGSGHLQGSQSGLDVLLGRQGGNEVEGLEDEPDRGGADLGQLGFPQRGQVTAVELGHAGGGAVQGAEDLQQGGFAVPGGALDGQPFAVLDDQVHPGQRVHGVRAFAVVLGDPGQLVHGCPFLLAVPAAYATWASAAAGRSRAARHPPNDPAISPPAIASSTASSTTLSVTDVSRETVTV